MEVKYRSAMKSRKYPGDDAPIAITFYGSAVQIAGLVAI
jgi:hypothetical protein